MRGSTQKSKALKCFSSFIILILITLAVSVHASAAVGSVMTDSARIDRFTYNATTKTNHLGLRDAATSSSDSKSMLLADGRGTSSTGKIRADIHYVDWNGNGKLDYGTDTIVYCLHNRKRSPSGSQTYSVLNYNQTLNYTSAGWRDETVANDSKTLKGLLAILQNGFPVKSAAEMGLSDNGSAFAATQMAVRFWVAERERDLGGFTWNYNYFDQSRSGFGTITALSGQQPVLDKARSLLSLARNPPARNPAISTTLVSANETRSQRDYFIYQYRVNLTDLSDGYTIKSTSLPSGSSYTGYTGKNGDVLQIKIPFTQANAGVSFSFQLKGTDSADASSLEFRPVPSGATSYQGLIGINLNTADIEKNTSSSSTTRTIADPYVSSITTNKSVYAPGETGTATIVLQNKGNRRTENFVLSVNGTQYSVSWIDPPNGSSTKSRTVSASFKVPSTASGTWNLPIKVDANDNVLEVNQSGIGENNNNVTKAITIGYPDLNITTLTTNKTTYAPGETVTVTTNVQNKGSISSAASTLTLTYPSGTSGTATTTRSIPALSVGSSWGTQTFTFTAPSPTSTQQYSVKVSIPTGQTKTGTTTRTVTITVQGYPDLDITTLTTNKTTYEPGETVTVTTNVKNKGNFPSAPSVLTLTYPNGAGGMEMTKRSIPALSAGSSWGTQTFTFTAPSPASAQQYSVGVNIPADQSETGTTSRTTTITVQGCPDLTGTIETVGGKTTYEAGETVRIQLRIMNTGQSKAGSFRSSFSITLRDGTNIVAGYQNDFPIETLIYNSSGLSVGGTITPQIVSFTAPSSLSAEDIDMEFKVDIDDAVNESNENNNSATCSIKVNPLRPNLYFSEHNVTNYYAGQYVIITARVMNGSEFPVPEAEVTLTFAGQTLTEKIPVQGKGAFSIYSDGFNYDGNLAVFKVKTPNVSVPTTYEVLMDITPLSTETNTEDNALGYHDSEGRFKRLTSTVSPLVRNEMPPPDDERLERDHIARIRVLPQVPLPLISKTHQWYETRIVDGEYIPHRFTATLSTEFTVMPDSRVAIRDYPKMMESGFGLSAEAKTMMLSNYDRPEKLVEPQLIWTMYPETEYWQSADWYLCNDMLVKKKGPTNDDPTTTWQLPVSQYTYFPDGIRDESIRLHYTPVWTPDGKYEVLCRAFYAFSPMGQMYEEVTDYIDIKGNMYERFPIFNH